MVDSMSYHLRSSDGYSSDSYCYWPHSQSLERVHLYLSKEEIQSFQSPKNWQTGGIHSSATSLETSLETYAYCCSIYAQLQLVKTWHS